MLITKHLNKIAVLTSVLLIANPVFADEKSKHKKYDREKVEKKFSRHGGKKATQAPLDAEIADRIAADQVLQNNINTISLTPGPQGEMGAAGPQGIQGEAGIGAQGIQGETGLAGTDGKNGTQGEQGIQGNQGEQGIVGNDGATGDKGDKGDQGIAGANGTSCSAIQGDGSATISCEDGSMASVYDGETASVSARKTYFITSSGQAGSEMGNLGIKPERTLTINKVSNISDLRLTHVDLRRNINATDCIWELRVDGQSCPSGVLSTRLYTSYQSESSGAFVGYCSGIPAGTHQVQVHVSRLGSSGNCWTGANSTDVTTTFLLEAEEVN